MSGSLPVLRHFKDAWRRQPAECILLGHGNGPEGEAVRLVFRRQKRSADLLYIASGTPRCGAGRQALQYLRTLVDDICVIDASPVAQAFWLQMADEGLVDHLVPLLPEEWDDFTKCGKGAGA